LPRNKKETFYIQDQKIVCKNERFTEIIYLEKGDYKSYNQSPDTNPCSPGKELNFITLRESIQSLNKQLNKIGTVHAISSEQ